MILNKNVTNLVRALNVKLSFNKQLSAQSQVNVKESENPSTVEWKESLPYDKIPGPSRMEILRSFMPGGKFYKKSRDQISKLCQQKYGQLVRIPGSFGQKDVVFAFNPNNFEKIYRTEGIWPARRGLDTLAYYRNNIRPEIFKKTGSLLTSNEDVWGKFRTMVNPVMMQPRTVRIYVPRMDNTTRQLVERIRNIRDPSTNEVPGTFERDLNNWALEQICLVGLDTELGLINETDKNPDAIKLIDTLTKIFTLPVDLEFKPSIWKLVATPKFNQLMKAYDDLTDISKKYIDEAMERFEKNPSKDKDDNESSVVERLLRVDKDVAVVMAMEMFFAGVDTTTSSVTACLLSLAKNPEKQEKLRAEVMTILPDKDKPLTEQNLKNMPYLRAVIKESIRCYPIVHENFRTATQSFVLDNYQIPKGTDLLMLGSHLYSNSSHFSEPEKFIPERWLRNQSNEDVASGCPMATKAANPFAYLPFGFGSRMCIGKRMVEMEMEIALVRLIRNFNVEFNYSTEDIFDLRLIYTPVSELKFKFTDIE